MSRATCPTPAELKAFQEGDLPEATLAEVSEHLETCPRCEELARALDEQVDPVAAAFRPLRKRLQQVHRPVR